MATRDSSIKAAACFYPGNTFESGGGGPSPFAASNRITTHMAAFFGNDDVNPSPADAARLDAELTRLGVEHSFHSYDGTAHGFMNDTRARDYREASATDAWDKLMTLFSERLKAPVAAS
jgi:carboxymethylenebutenolidase